MAPDGDPDGDLRRELIGMLRRDQRWQSGGADPEGPDARTSRLAEIIDEHGWPTESAVGRRAALAAWVVAQHSDLDVAFQRRALGLLELAVAQGEGSAGDLAYLTDRVAVAEGRRQAYGTQIRCTPTGARPATPIADKEGVDLRRTQAGLEPLTAYLDDVGRDCPGTG